MRTATIRQLKEAIFNELNTILSMPVVSKAEAAEFKQAIVRGIKNALGPKEKPTLKSINLDSFNDEDTVINEDALEQSGE